MTAHTVLDSPIGPITLVGTDGALTGLYMEAHKHIPDPAGFGAANAVLFGEVREQLEQYFAGRRTEFDVPLAPAGTEFQHLVWRELRDVRFGETTTYGEIAERIGRPKAARAVGAANGRNPISIIVPCHRVLGSDGKLVDYGGGLDRKQHLLALEQRVSAETR